MKQQIVGYGDESFDEEWFIYAFVLIKRDSDILKRLVRKMRYHVRNQSKMGILTAKEVSMINDQLHEHVIARQYRKIWQQCLDIMHWEFIMHPEDWRLFSVRMPVAGCPITKHTRTEAYVIALRVLDAFWTRQPFRKAQLHAVTLDTLPADINVQHLRNLSLGYSWDTSSHRQQETLIIADWIAAMVRRAQPHQNIAVAHKKTCARHLHHLRVRVWQRDWPSSIK